MFLALDLLSLSSKEGKRKGTDLLHALHSLTKQCEITIIVISLLDITSVT